MTTRLVLDIGDLKVFPAQSLEGKEGFVAHILSARMTAFDKKVRDDARLLASLAQQLEMPLEEILKRSGQTTSPLSLITALSSSESGIAGIITVDDLGRTRSIRNSVYLSEADFSDLYNSYSGVIQPSGLINKPVIAVYDQENEPRLTGIIPFCHLTKLYSG